MATPTTLPASFTSGQVLTAAQMNNLRGAFRVLQVVSTSKTDTFVSGAVAQGAETDITGLSVTITPSATSSLVLIVADVCGIAAVSGNRSMFGVNVYRAATPISRGDAAGSRTRVSRISGDESVSVSLQNIHLSFLDNPATTSATTYKLTAVNALSVAASATMYVNRTITDTDNSAWPRTASSITVMEISA